MRYLVEANVNNIPVYRSFLRDDLDSRLHAKIGGQLNELYAFVMKKAYDMTEDTMKPKNISIRFTQVDEVEILKDEDGSTYDGGIWGGGNANWDKDDDFDE